MNIDQDRLTGYPNGLLVRVVTLLGALMQVLPDSTDSDHAEAVAVVAAGYASGLVKDVEHGVSLDLRTTVGRLGDLVECIHKVCPESTDGDAARAVAWCTSGLIAEFIIELEDRLESASLAPA